MAVQLNITVEEQDGVLVATIEGPVDSATIEHFKEVLDPVFYHHKNGRILLDCSHLTYINSRAIGLLSAYHRSLLMHMGNMAICGLNPRIVRTVALLGLGKKLKTYPTREEAIAALKE